MLLVRRHQTPCLVPVVTLPAWSKPVGLVDEHLRGNARTKKDGIEFRRVHRSGFVEFLQAYVRIGVLQGASEVLVLKHRSVHAPDVGKCRDVDTGNDRDCTRKGQKER